MRHSPTRNWQAGRRWGGKENKKRGLKRDRIFYEVGGKAKVNTERAQEKIVEVNGIAAKHCVRKNSKRSKRKRLAKDKEPWGGRLENQGESFQKGKRQENFLGFGGLGEEEWI